MGRTAPMSSPAAETDETRRFTATPRALPGVRRVARLVESGRAAAGDLVITHGHDRAVLDDVLLDALTALARGLDAGRPVTVVVGEPTERELSSQEAADLLNVSRPHVVKLANEGRLPHRKVGNRHRFRLEDVHRLDRMMRAARADDLAALAPAKGYTVEDF